MSYNKQQALVANVAAIETAMRVRIAHREATQEEKQVLALYSGFGGIKEVLDIGTDKPIAAGLQEPLQRLQTLIAEYPCFTDPMREAAVKNLKSSVLTVLVLSALNP